MKHDHLASPLSSPEVEETEQPTRKRRLSRILGKLAGRGSHEAPLANQESDKETSLGFSGAQVQAMSITQQLVREHRLTHTREESASLDEALGEAIAANSASRAKKVMRKANLADTETGQALERTFASSVDLASVVYYDNHDAEFIQWASASSDLAHHTEKPPESGDYILPELGVSAQVVPKFDRLALTVKTELGIDRTTVPLKKGVEWINPLDIYGTRREAVRSQFEVFGAIAEKTDIAYTHVTGVENLPGILTSEEWGGTPLRGSEARGRGGMNFEEGKLGEASAYQKLLDKLAAGEGSAEAPIHTQDGKGSFISSGYLNPGDTDPIILFDKRVTDEGHREWIVNPGGIAVIGKTRFDDPDFIGIWVTPTYKEKLEQWIDSWPDERKRQIFGERDPHSVLIATADDLPERYRPSPKALEHEAA